MQPGDWQSEIDSMFTKKRGQQPTSAPSWQSDIDAMFAQPSPPGPGEKPRHGLAPVPEDVPLGRFDFPATGGGGTELGPRLDPYGEQALGMGDPNVISTAPQVYMPEQPLRSGPMVMPPDVQTRADVSVDVPRAPTVDEMRYRRLQQLPPDQLRRLAEAEQMPAIPPEDLPSPWEAVLLQGAEPIIRNTAEIPARLAGAAMGESTPEWIEDVGLGNEALRELLAQTPSRSWPEAVGRFTTGVAGEVAPFVTPLRMLSPQVGMAHAGGVMGGALGGSSFAGKLATGMYGGIAGFTAPEQIAQAAEGRTSIPQAISTTLTEPAKFPAHLAQNIYAAGEAALGDLPAPQRIDVLRENLMTPLVMGIAGAAGGGQALRGRRVRVRNPNAPVDLPPSLKGRELPPIDTTPVPMLPPGRMRAPIADTPLPNFMRRLGPRMTPEQEARLQGEPNAEILRKDAGLVQAGGDVGQGGEAQGGANLQRQAEAGAKAGWTEQQVAGGPKTEASPEIQFNRNSGVALSDVFADYDKRLSDLANISNPQELASYIAASENMVSGKEPTAIGRKALKDISASTSISYDDLEPFREAAELTFGSDESTISPKLKMAAIESLSSVGSEPMQSADPIKDAIGDLLPNDAMTFAFILSEKAQRLSGQDQFRIRFITDTAFGEGAGQKLFGLGQKSSRTEKQVAAQPQKGVTHEGQKQAPEGQTPKSEVLKSKLQEKYDIARKELAARALGGQTFANMVFDPKTYGYALDIAKYHIDRGIRSFAEFTRVMKDEIKRLLNRDIGPTDLRKMWRDAPRAVVAERDALALAETQAALAKRKPKALAKLDVPKETEAGVARDRFNREIAREDQGVTKGREAKKVNNTLDKIPWDRLKEGPTFGTIRASASKQNWLTDLETPMQKIQRIKDFLIESGSIGQNAYPEAFRELARAKKSAKLDSFSATAVGQIKEMAGMFRKMVENAEKLVVAGEVLNREAFIKSAEPEVRTRKALASGFVHRMYSRWLDKNDKSEAVADRTFIKTYARDAFRNMNTLMQNVGGKFGNKLWKLTVENVQRSWDKADTDVYRYDRMVEDVDKRLNLTEGQISDLSISTVDTDLGGVHRYKMTPMQRVALSLSLDRESTLKSLSGKNSEGWILSNLVLDGKRKVQMTPDELIEAKQRLDSSLTKTEQSYKDTFRKILDEIGEGIDRTHLAQYDTRIAEKNYFTRQHASDLVQTNMLDPTNSFKAMRAWLEDMGLLKDAPGTSSPIIIGDARVIVLSHVRQATKYIHMAQEVRQALEVLGDPRIKQAVTDTWGSKVLKQYTDMLNQALGMNGLRTAIDVDSARAMGYMSNKFSVASLGAPSITPVASSYVGSFMLAAEFPMKWRPAFYKNLLKATFMGPKARQALMDKMVEGKAGYLLERINLPSAMRHSPGKESITSAVSKTALGRGSKALEDVAMKPTAIADNNQTFAAFLTALERVRADNPKWSDAKVYEQAGWEAGQAVRNTQNVAHPADQTYFQQYGVRHPFARPLTLFTSSPATISNYVDQAWHELRSAGLTGPAVARFADKMMAVGLNTAGMTGVRALQGAVFGSKKRDDKKKMNLAEQALVDIVGDLTSLVVPVNVASDVTRTVTKAAMGKSTFGSTGVQSPLGSTAESLVGRGIIPAVEAVVKGLHRTSSQTKLKKAVEVMARELAKFAPLGAPLSQSYRMGKNVYRAKTGKEFPAG